MQDAFPREYRMFLQPSNRLGVDYLIITHDMRFVIKMMRHDCHEIRLRRNHSNTYELSESSILIVLTCTKHSLLREHKFQVIFFSEIKHYYTACIANVPLILLFYTG